MASAGVRVVALAAAGRPAYRGRDDCVRKRIGSLEDRSRNAPAEIRSNQADVVPVAGSADYYALHRWNGDDDLPTLSFDYRLRRAIRVVDVAQDLVTEAVQRIDEVVSTIETCAIREFNTGDILATWGAVGDDASCVACDFKHFCPTPYGVRSGSERAGAPPLAPG